MVGSTLSRRSFLKLALTAILNLAALTGGGLIYASSIEPGWLRIAPLQLVLQRLPQIFDGYRIAQISDIHIGTWINRERLLKVVQQINTLSPDLVVLTGDFVHHTPELYVDDLVETLSQMKPTDGTLAVLGNHDHWTNPVLVREVLKKSNIVDLSNRVFSLERGNACLNIAGVDDLWEHLDRLDLVMDALPPGDASVLLAHEPDFADRAARTGRFDLRLSGHSHGGQVRIPFFGPLILPLYGRKYPFGLYKIGNMFQYTNSGIGMIFPTIRFNCRPEITLFTLKSPGGML